MAAGSTGEKKGKLAEGKSRKEMTNSWSHDSHQRQTDTLYIESRDAENLFRNLISFFQICLSDARNI